MRAHHGCIVHVCNMFILEYIFKCKCLAYLFRRSTWEFYARGTADDRIADSERRLRREKWCHRGRASGVDGETRRSHLHGDRNRRTRRCHNRTRSSDIYDHFATQAAQVFRQSNDRESSFSSWFHLRHRGERRGFDGVHLGRWRKVRRTENERVLYILYNKIYTLNDWLCIRSMFLDIRH